MLSDLAIFGGPLSVDRPPPHYVWPVITRGVREAVITQMDRSLSIYDDSGVFGEFEKTFALYHGRKYALLFNSGTAALHAAYFALNCSPKTVIAVPAYTFFATVSPATQTGTKLSFIDCNL